MAIRYKFTFAGSIVSALAVAVLWGANIGAVYPVVEVVLQDRSMHQWVDGKIEGSRARRVAAKVGRLGNSCRRRRRPTPVATRKLQQNIANAEGDLATATKALRAYEFAKPYIDHYLPASPFRTLVLVTGLWCWER